MENSLGIGNRLKLLPEDIHEKHPQPAFKAIFITANSVQLMKLFINLPKNVFRENALLLLQLADVPTYIKMKTYSISLSLI